MPEPGWYHSDAASIGPISVGFWHITICLRGSCCCTQIAKVMGPTWGPPGSCRPQMGPMLAPWTLLSGWCWWKWRMVAALVICLESHYPTSLGLREDQLPPTVWTKGPLYMERHWLMPATSQHLRSSYNVYSGADMSTRLNRMYGSHVLTVQSVWWRSRSWIAWHCCWLSFYSIPYWHLLI